MKRPLEEENLTELSFEPPKHHDSNKKLLLVTEDFPSHPTAPRVISPGMVCYCISHFQHLPVIDYGYMMLLWTPHLDPYLLSFSGTRVLKYIIT